MSESPRWERESQDLSPSASPEETVEFDMAAAGLVDDDLSDPPEYVGSDEDVDANETDDPSTALEPVVPGEPRLAAARESFAEALDGTRASLNAARGSLTTTAGRVGRWFAALDRRPEFDADVRRDPVAELQRTASTVTEPTGSEAGETDPGRFPTAPLGYNRHAVDRHLAVLEEEIARLREHAHVPLTISEEIERLGEQTASILVVAHDKAHETARRAEERAHRAVDEAAQDAERITTDAQRRLRVLDEETDAVWRERERLLEDVKVVSAALASLADDAVARFPAAPEPSADPAPVAQPTS